jgi:two-component system, OmpR family, alkaline phosphatase synthesis response regulator PhoP
VTRIAPRVLLVEDEESLVVTLRDRLEAEGYRVEARGDAEAALALAAEKPFDLAVLDVMLPGMDGFALCRELRARGLALPVLMLTARSQVVDKVVGLKLGADDYLTKPFEMIELLARLEALLRRRAAGTIGADVFVFGDVKADFRRAEMTRGGEPVALSSLEMRLLRYLIEHRGEVLSRERLLDEVWGYDATPVSRTVDVHVAALRSKLEANPSHPVFIVTVHRLGYRFDG